MILHAALVEKLNDALVPRPPLVRTRRDATLSRLPGKVHAVIGLRRAGKTTFLQQLLADRRQEVAPERAVYLSFDDDRLGELDVAQLGLLLEEYFRRFSHLRGQQTTWWFLDEIQLVPGWEQFARRLIDSEDAELVVSGSSARMLSREVHTALRGRGAETVIRPFGFREFLRHRGEEPTRAVREWTSPERSRVEGWFREYLASGGFPEAQGLETSARVELLQGYVNNVLFRDVVERHGVAQVAALRWITRQCLRNPAGSFSVHRLHQDLRAQGLGVAKDAVSAMIEHLVDAFLIATVPLSTLSERQQNSNPRKVYPADVGFIGAFDRSGRSNAGHALETLVFHELDRRKAEIGYVKTDDGREVDFHARYLDGREELVQVCLDPSEPEVRRRELRALEEAVVRHPRARRVLLVLDRDDRLDVEGVEVMPVYQWLLDHPR